MRLGSIPAAAPAFHTVKVTVMVKSRMRGKRLSFHVLLLFFLVVLLELMVTISCNAPGCFWEKENNGATRGLSRHRATCQHYQKSRHIASQKRLERAKQAANIPSLGKAGRLALPSKESSSANSSVSMAFNTNWFDNLIIVYFQKLSPIRHKSIHDRPKPIASCQPASRAYYGSQGIVMSPGAATGAWGLGHLQDSNNQQSDIDDNVENTFHDALGMSESLCLCRAIIH